ncbi:hypothetical protein FPV67DRAFT_1477851 [Lyophyllum atratum]|nr:hypothetical protein FPV67DRAFT_1477851 [Lyophyllum atratum]
MANIKAQIEKEKGNAAFKSGDYPNAIGHYSAAIIADRTDYTLPLNRAAAYLKLGKHEDAERDCTTVLNLSALNAKALFRRGQARLGMGKLDEALSDFTQALKREPSNDAIKQEIKKVNDLLEKKRSKENKFKKSDQPSPSAAPKRRRVPITIVDPTGPPAAPTAPPSQKPSKKTAIAPAPKSTPNIAPSVATSSTDDLKPISTRSLKLTSESAPSTPPTTSKSSDTTPPAPKPPTPAPAPVPASAPSPTPPKPEQPRTFKDAKQARESGKPSRVGGGIFRASGENTLFPPRGSASNASPKHEPGPSSLAPPKSPPPSSPMNIDAQPVADDLRPVPPAKAPTTLFEFSTAWEAASSTAERWGLILSVPPPRIPALVKTSLEPGLLISILTVFGEVLRVSPNAAAMVREYLDAFAKVERFGTIVMFLSPTEKAVAREVWETIGATKEDVDRVWRPVWV